MRLACLSLIAAVLAAAETFPCASPPDVNAFLADTDNRASVPYRERRASAEARLAEMLEKHPRDLALHLRRRTLLGGPMGDAWKEQIHEYRRLTEVHPGDPLYRFLYAKSIAGFETPEAIHLFDELLKGEAAIPQAHLELASIYSWGAFADPGKVAAHLNEYRAACPDSVEPFRYWRRTNDQARLERGAQQLRKLLDPPTAGDVQRLDAWETLWAMEFRGRPASGHDALRQRVAADIRGLAALPLPDSIRKIRQLQEGYRLLNNPEAVRRLDDELLEKFPETRTAMQIVQSRFHEANPYPRSKVRRDEIEWARKQREAAREWAARWPGAASPYSNWLGALALLDEVEPAEFEEVAGKLLSNYESQIDEFRSFPPIHYRIADVSFRHDIGIERVPRLIRAGTLELDAHREKGSASDADSRDGGEGNYGLWFSQGAPMHLVAELRLGHPEEARRVLRELEAYDLANPPQGERRDRTSAMRKEILWEMRGQLAEKEGRTADAAVFYLRAQALRTAPPGSRRSHRVDVGRRAGELWKQAGGTAEGLQALAERDVAATEGEGWRKSSRTLPDFEITDTAGRIWRTRDLKGKRVFINFWATWCGWCHPELPEVQKLYEQTKRHDGIAVISLNLDDNPGLIEPYMVEKGYTFPVLPALALMERLSLAISLPRNWVTNADGIVEWEQHGFQLASPPSQWLRGRALELLEAK
ncbi:MAG: TlpA disulfide reductase family protein [Bryobacteraceae bacterium]